MEGSITPLYEVKSDHRWVRHLQTMGVKKVGLWIPNYGGQDELSRLLPGCSYPAPFRNFLVSYTGFCFKPVGMFCRDLDTKDFRLYSSVDHFNFYVAQQFDARWPEFRYGDKLVLLEGVLDAEAFVYLTGSPWVMAYLKANVGPHMAAVIASMTDKVLVVPDKDAAGVKAFEKTKRGLSTFGVQVHYLDIERKDFGVVLDKMDMLDVQRAKVALNF